MLLTMDLNILCLSSMTQQEGDPMIAIFASGTGSNFEALANNFPNQICALLCNVEGAPVLNLAKKNGISSFLIPHKNFKTREDHEKEILRILKQFPNLKLVVLAGYMRVLTPFFFQEFFKLGIQIINLHPAHLCDYKGPAAYEYAVENKFSRWGLSVHNVTEQLDSGELLNSTEFSVYPYETANDVKKRVKTLEHNLLVATVKNILKE